MILNIANCQYTAAADESATLKKLLPLIAEAATRGADLIALPECATMLEPNRQNLRTAATNEADSKSLEILRETATKHQCYLLIGSLMLRTDANPQRLINRGFLIAPDGNIRARYDKIHLFDVEINDGQIYHESSLFDAGKNAVLVNMDAQHQDAPHQDGWHLGLTICYDLRFPHLYRQLAQAGADIIAVPAAFTATTGAAHWHTLLRARAIENGIFVIAPAQCGTHAGGRQTYGHSLIVSPWGEVLADAKDTIGITMASLDLAAIRRARQSIPSLANNHADSIPLNIF